MIDPPEIVNKDGNKKYFWCLPEHVEKYTESVFKLTDPQQIWGTLILLVTK